VFPGFSAGDLSGTRILDHDMREVIDDFATHVETDGIDLTVFGFSSSDDCTRRRCRGDGMKLALLR
jgi:hypothetical protein